MGTLSKLVRSTLAGATALGSVATTTVTATAAEDLNISERFIECVQDGLPKVVKYADSQLEAIYELQTDKDGSAHNISFLSDIKKSPDIFKSAGTINQGVSISFTKTSSDSMIYIISTHSVESKTGRGTVINPAYIYGDTEGEHYDQAQGLKARATRLMVNCS